MLFLTNRVLKQNNQTRLGRTIDFDLRDTNALQSLFCCERTIEDDSVVYTEIGSEAFLQRLKDSPAEQILAFIHGFDNLPENAVFQRATELQELFDAAQPNLVEVIALVWPSQGAETTVEFIKDYYADENAADASDVAFARALAKLEAWQQTNIENGTPCLKRLNVLAHSMGNRVFRGTVKYWSEEILGHEPPLLFRNVFMAAADVENETLQRDQDGGMIPMMARNVVVYHTYEDLALRASKAANASTRSVSRRLGHTGPYDMTKVPANVYAVNCDSFAMAYDPNKGHTYFLRDPRDNSPGLAFKHILNCVQTASPQSNADRRFTL
jgi:esterase/lipase superfamily enzyme